MRVDVLVVGGGAMGLAAARSLASRGGDVLLVDPLPLLNDLNASNDESKVFRLAYGADEAYTRLAVTALDGWRALERETGATVLAARTGLLMLDGEFAAASERTLSRLGLPVERWERADLARRAPAWAGVAWAVLDPNGALLDPRAALGALERSAAARGARILRGRSVVSLDDATATLDDGRRVEARQIVLAPGFLAPSLLPALSSVVRVTRQAELFFAPPDASFAPERFPVFAAFERGFYGFPTWEGAARSLSEGQAGSGGPGAVKVADYRFGRVVDPRAPRGRAAVGDEDAARAFLTAHLPALATSPLVRSRVCLYDATPDEHFLLGRISDHAVLACGFSGHGIKFAPAVGDLVAALVEGTEPAHPLGRHDPARFGPLRSVM